MGIRAEMEASARSQFIGTMMGTAFTSSPWSPLSLGSSLAAWYRADGVLWQDAARTTRAVADGDPVGCWDDASGNGFHMKQSTDALRPTLKVSTQNGKPSVRFNGSTQFLAADHAARLSLASHMYIFMAAKTASGNDGVFIEKGAHGVAFNYGMSDLSGRLCAASQAGTGAGPLIGRSTFYTLDVDQAEAQTVFGKNGVESTVAGSPDLFVTNTETLSLGMRTGLGYYYGGDASEVILAGTVAGVVLTSAQKASARAYLRTKYEPTKPQVLFSGNSITVGFGLADPDTQSFPAQTLALLGGLNSYDFANYGHNGEVTASLDASCVYEIDNKYGVARQRNVAVLWECTNDLFTNQVAADAYSRYVTYCQNRQAAGFKVVAMTVLPRSGGGTYAGFEADRQTVNASIRSNWANFADALADVGADATIGEPGDELNATYYQDALHPTAAGAAVAAALCAAAIGTL